MVDIEFYSKAKAIFIQSWEVVDRPVFESQLVEAGADIAPRQQQVD